MEEFTNSDLYYSLPEDNSLAKKFREASLRLAQKRAASNLFGGALCYSPTDIMVENNKNRQMVIDELARLGITPVKQGEAGNGGGLAASCSEGFWER